MFKLIVFLVMAAHMSTVAASTPEETPKAKDNSLVPQESQTFKTMFDNVKKDYLVSVMYENLARMRSHEAPLGGLSLAALGKFSSSDVWGAAPFFQPSLQWMSIGGVAVYRPLPGLTQETTTDVNAAVLGLDVGASFPGVEHLNVDVHVGYKMSLYGKSSSETKSEALKETSSRTLSKLKWASIGARGLYDLGTHANVGVEIAYKGFGRLKLSDANESQFTGYSVGLVGNYKF